MDDKERGGLQLPNFKLYQNAICLTWISGWIKLSNKKLLNLEGFNKRYGWHSYLMYDKLKVDSMFAHHYIRGSLIKVWQKYSNKLDKKRPLWISPLQVIEIRMKYAEDKIITYQDFIEIENEQNVPIRTYWFQFLQIRNLFDKNNRKYGFRGASQNLRKLY